MGEGVAVNEVRFSHNDFGQSVRTYQAHDSAVDLMATPSARMGFADGGAKTVRPNSVTYCSVGEAATF